MSAWDALWHVLNLFAAAAGLALISVAVVKALWRWDSAHQSWWGLWWPSALTAQMADGVAWWWHGAQGSMAGYAAMVVAVALVLWLRVFMQR